MDISFPILHGSEQDPDVLAEHLSQVNERGDSGHYPIGANNFWHGGVHFETDEPVRAIGNGVVVAYRFNKHALECEIQTANVVKRQNGRYILIDRAEHGRVHWRVESDFAKETDTAREHYSNSFVLTKHVYVTPLGGRIVFYALYMHLMPFDDYVDGQHQPSIFRRDAYFVKTHADGGGVGVYQDDGSLPARILPVGTEFTVLPKEATDAPDWRELTAFDGGGRVRLDPGAVREVAENRYRVVHVVEKPPAGDMGIATHATRDPKSMVTGIIPADSPLHFKGGKPTPGAMSELDGGGWIQCDVGKTIEKKKTGLWPEKFDAVIHPEPPIPISRGDILGYAGPYRVAPNLLHFEIILESVGFLDNPAGDTWGPQIFRIPVGHAFKTRVPTANPAVQVNLATHEVITIHHVDEDSPYAQISSQSGGARCWITRNEYFVGKTTGDTMMRQAKATAHSQNPYDCFDLSTEAPKNAREIVAYATDEWQEHATGGRWFKFRYEGVEGWTRARDVGPFGQPAYDWAHAGWKKVEDSRYSDDGFCNAPDLLIALDEDHSGIITLDEMKHALAKPEVAEKVRRFVCKHPTEWAPAGKKYERLKTGRWFMPKALYDQTMEHHKRLEWWNEVPNLTPRASGAWHVHPIEFLRYLKALPGITGDQLCAMMFQMGVGRPPGGISAPTVRSRMSLPATMSAADVVQAYYGRLRGFVRELNENMQKYRVMAASHGMTRRRQAHFVGQMAQECYKFLAMSEDYGPTLSYAPFYGRGAIQLTWADNYHHWYRSDDNRSLFPPDEQLIMDKLGQLGHEATNLNTVYTAQERARLPQILDRLKEPSLAMNSAGWYWHKNHCNPGANSDDAETTTRIVNGWYTALAERVQWIDLAKSVLLRCSY